MYTTKQTLIVPFIRLQNLILSLDDIISVEGKRNLEAENPSQAYFLRINMRDGNNFKLYYPDGIMLEKVMDKLCCE